jgi:hypothetical protein
MGKNAHDHSRSSAEVKIVEDRNPIADTLFMSLHQIVYLSERSKTMADAELKAIIDSASITNFQKGISGLLLSAGGHFMQLLEGELLTIRPLFDKISRDPRHSNVSRLLERPAEARLFPGWGMKLTDSRSLPLDQDRINKTLIRIRLSADKDQSVAAMQLLNEFRAQLMSRAA